LKVEIYTKDHCIWCDRAKGLLNAHFIDFEEFDLSNDEERVQFYEKLGDNVKTVPQVFINDQRVGGYQDLRAWLNE
jgi:glutaredoxin